MNNNNKTRIADHLMPNLHVNALSVFNRLSLEYKMMPAEISLKEENIYSKVNQEVSNG